MPEDQADDRAQGNANVHWLTRVWRRLTGGRQVRADAPDTGEAALRERDQQYQAMVLTLNEGVLIFDDQGRVRGGNPAAERLLRRSLAEMKALNLGDWRPIGSDGLPLAPPDWPVAKVLATGISQRDVLLGEITASGAAVWFNVNVEPWRHPDSGELRGAVVSITDVTERRRVEEALLGSEFNNLTLMNAIADGVFIAQDERFVYANPALPRMLGYDIGEFAGLPFESVVTPELLPIWTARFRQRVGTGDEPVRAYEVSFVHRDGQQRLEVELVASRASYQGRPAVLGVVRDITERKRLAAELDRHRHHLEERVAERTLELRQAMDARAELETFAQTITDNQPTLLAYVDRELRLRFANRAWLNWFGRTREETIGHLVSEFLDPKLMAQRQPTIDRVFKGEPVEMMTTMTGGAQRSGHFWIHRLPDQRHGEVRGYFFIASDVTEVREQELQLKTVNQALTDARDRAEAAVRAKSAFLANMSHEIRTPMNAILGLSHLMQRDTRDPQSLDRIGKVLDAAQHLLDIINDILDLSKIESGKLTLELLDFSLDALLSRSCALVAGPARDKGLELVIDTDALPRMLHGDPTRLSQALVNLLGNAVKFTERGSVTLRGELLTQTDDYLLVRFEVRDSGIGIPASRLPHLFTAFEQADSSTTRRYGGTGLGLAITHHLAQLMGGEAGAESELGVGSRFWFTARLLPAQSGTSPVEGIGLLNGLHALLVDDLPEAREALGAMLHHLGLRVDLASSGPEALAMTRRAITRADPYQLVVLDWLMPDMNGLQTARQLLEDHPDPVPAMVIVSAANDDAMRSEAQALGIDCVLEKPVSYSTLNDRLLQLLIDHPVSGPGELLDGPPGAAIEWRLTAAQHGSRVLLAEDNPVNQEVGTELLRSVGLQVDIADTGQAAVQKARSGLYDLILMDMQMPEMDGLQASRLIRETPGLADIPIIAMTANAFGEDRLACLAAGMNDHVGKPVVPKLLFETLSRWLPQVSRAARAASGHAAPAPSGNGWLDLEGIDADRGLTYFAGNQEAYRSALRTFAQLYGSGLPAVVQYLSEPGNQAALGKLRRELHSLGGASAAIGAMQLGEGAAQLESVLRDPRRGMSLAEPLAALSEALADTVARLDTWLAGPADVHAIRE